MIADRLRAAILQAAISGKLTDQHPEDGTATELLETIKPNANNSKRRAKLRSRSHCHQWTKRTSPSTCQIVGFGRV